MATINDFILTNFEISNMVRCFDSDREWKGLSSVPNYKYRLQFYTMFPPQHCILMQHCRCPTELYAQSACIDAVVSVLLMLAVHTCCLLIIGVFTYL
jgi:hypothetical protein